MDVSPAIPNENEKEWELFFQLTSEKAILLSSEGKILKASSYFRQKTSKNTLDLSEKLITYFIHSSDQQNFKEVLEKANEKVSTINIRFAFDTRNYHYYTCKIARVNDNYFCVIHKSNAKQTFETEISDGERRLKKLIQCGNERLDIISADGIYTYTSLSSDNILGYPPESYLGRNPLELIHPEDEPMVAACMQRILTEARIDIPPFRYIDANGNWLWVDTILTNMLHDPDICGIVANSSDHTALRQITEGNKNLAKRLTNIIENFSEGYFTLSKDWRLLSFNAAAQKLVGIPKERLQNANFWELFPGHNDLKFYKEYSRSFKENKPVSFQEFYPSMGMWVEINAYPYEESLTVFIKDITELKVQQITLKLEKDVLEMNVSSNFSLKQIVDYFLNGLEGIYPDMLTSVLVADKNCTHLDLLSAPSLPDSFSKEIDGIHINEGEGACGTAAYINDLVVIKDINTHPYTQKYIPFAQVTGIKSCWSIPINGANNRVLATFGIYYTDIKAPGVKEIEAIKRVGVTLRLLLESNSAKIELQNSNERYRLATAATNDAIWDFNIQTNELFWGEGFQKLFGHPIDDPARTTESWSDLVYPEDKASVLESFHKAFADVTQNTWKQDYRFMKADGTFAYVRDHGLIIRDDQGIPVRVTGAIQDITKRRANLQKLKNSEENYRLLFSNNPVPMWGYDLQTLKFVAVNNAAKALYGYTEEEFLKMDLYDIRPKAEHARLRQIINQKSFLTDLKLTHEWAHLKKDQSVITVELVSHMIELNGKKTRLVAITDITEKKRAQRELTEQNLRLREIAQISSHDIRGPVASILGLVNLFDQSQLDNKFNSEIINWLSVSAQELDQVLHTIVQKTWNEDITSSN
jgi:PAS domain S-box-containing protein